VDQIRGCALDISVVISTYNRCRLLPAALHALLAQNPADFQFEVLVVDNNSTDHTRSVVQSLAAQNPEKLKYVFEPKQGVSYGRNAGIANAKASIIAFTDDDVHVAPGWVYQIKLGFEANPDIDFLGGKVVPRWSRVPPSWLTAAHWTPLALLDYGDERFYVDSGRPLCLLSANLACRRRAFEKVGMFKTDFQRVRNGIGSLEDHELLLRLWRTNSRGLYLPELVVTTEIEPERMEKQYHRRWYAGHGRFYAELRAEEMERSRVGKILGVPAHFYRRALQDAFGWTFSMIRNQPSQAFQHEVQLHYFGGFLRRRWRDYLGLQSRRKSSEPIIGEPTPHD
jgi:glycosyltransferase involved in cell wall biosynthesis